MDFAEASALIIFVVAREAKTPWRHIGIGSPVSPIW